MENNIKQIKTIFIGTPDFAVPGLESLINDDNFKVVLAITQKDKKIGRKQVLSEPAVKICAKNNKISILQPDHISDVYNEIRELKPDLIVVIAYGQIIPKNILDIPKYACINVHASLLPIYRGASCIQAAILNQDKRTGITIMKMDEGLDTGPIIFQSSIDIDKTDTTGTLFNKLATLSSELLPVILKKFVDGKITLVEQDNSKASKVKLIKKESGQINCTDKADKVHAHIRAMTPWPGAYIIKDDIKIKIIEADIAQINKYQAATLFSSENKLHLQCGQDSLIINTIQVEGKNKISGSDFVKGYAKYLN